MKADTLLWIVMMVVAGGCTFPATASSLDFTYNPGNSQTEFWRGSKKESFYDVAIALKDPSLVGKSIVGLSVEIPEGDFSNLSGFLTSELKTRNVNGVKYNSPDITSEKATIVDGRLVVRFSSSYVIPEGGVFAGYSLSVSSATETGAPVYVARAAMPGGFYIHTTSGYKVWSDISEKMGLVSGLVVFLEGDFPAEDVSLSRNELWRVKVNEASDLPCILYNHGLTEISSIRYRTDVAGETIEGSIAFDPPLEVAYNRPKEISLTVPAVEEIGRHDVTVDVMEINGNPSTDKTSALSTVVDVEPFLPDKKVLMEEYTGTWCGNCVRGIGCMVYMKDRFPEKFIGISWHADYSDKADPMQILRFSDGFPNAPGFPTSYLDRIIEIDPTVSRVLPEWNRLSKDLTDAEIKVEASWSDTDCAEISVTSEVRMLNDIETPGYRIAFILVADGLQGSGPRWAQHNYYVGLQNVLEENPFMRQFVEGESTMFNFVFNDVVIWASDKETGTIPSSLTKYEPVSTTLTISKNAIVNIDGESLVQDSKRLRMVAVLLDPLGKVLNVAECPVEESCGIDSIATVEKSLSGEREYYDLYGNRILNPSACSSGIYIEKSDGGSRKVFIRTGNHNM